MTLRTNRRATRSVACCRRHSVLTDHRPALADASGWWEDCTNPTRERGSARQRCGEQRHCERRRDISKLCHLPISRECRVAPGTGTGTGTELARERTGKLPRVPAARTGRISAGVARPISASGAGSRILRSQKRSFPGAQNLPRLTLF